MIADGLHFVCGDAGAEGDGGVDARSSFQAGGVSGFALRKGGRYATAALGRGNSRVGCGVLFSVMESGIAAADRYLSRARS